MTFHDNRAFPESPPSLWHLSHRADPRAAALADRHYSRQKIGSPQFVPPGRCVVLLMELVRDAQSIAEALIAYEHADVRRLAFAVRHVARALEVALRENPEESEK